MFLKVSIYSLGNQQFILVANAKKETIVQQIHQKQKFLYKTESYKTKIILQDLWSLWVFLYFFLKKLLVKHFNKLPRAEYLADLSFY